MPNNANDIPILKKDEAARVEVVNIDAFKNILASLGEDKVRIGKTQLSKDEVKQILKESNKSQAETSQKQVEKTEELIDTIKDQKESQEKESEKSTEIGKKTHTEVKKLNDNLKTSHKEIKGLGSKVEKHKQILSDSFKEGLKNTVLGPWRLLITPLQSLFKTDFEEKIGEGFNKAKEKIFGKFKQKTVPSESDLSKTESGQAMLWYAKHQDKELKKDSDKGILGNVVKGLLGTTAGATIAGSLMKGGLSLKGLFSGFNAPWKKLEKVVTKQSIFKEGELFRGAGGKFTSKTAFELEQTALKESPKIIGKNIGKILGRGFVITNIVMSLFDVVGDAFKGFGKSKEFGASKGASVIGAALGGTNKGLMNVFGQMGKWAGIGAIAGSFIPGVGTIVGGLVGAGIGGVIGAIGGKNIAKGIDKLGKVFSGLIGNVWNFVIKMIPGAGAIDRILKSDMSFGAKASRLVIFAGSHILKLIGDIVTLKPIRQLIWTLGSKLVEGISSLIKNFSKINWKEVQEDIGNWFTKIFTSLGEAGGFIGDKILRPVGEMFITFFKDFFENFFENLYLQVAPIFTADGISALLKGGFEGKAFQTEKSKYAEGYKSKKLDELQKEYDFENKRLSGLYKATKNKEEKAAIGEKINDLKNSNEKEINRIKSLGGGLAKGGVALTPGILPVAEDEPELIIPKSKIEKGFDNKYVQEMFRNQQPSTDQKQLLLYTKMMVEEMKNLSKVMSKKDYNNIIMNNTANNTDSSYLQVDKNLRYPILSARGIL